MKPYPKYYRLILNSADARYTSGFFTWDINLPLFDNIHDKSSWVMSVASFFSSVIPSTGLNVGNTQIASSAFANIHIQELSQITSYSSRTRTNSDIVATYSGRSYVSSSVRDAIAIPVDEQWWIRKAITVSFSDINMTRLNTPADAPFQLCLLIWKADE